MKKIAILLLAPLFLFGQDVKVNGNGSAAEVLKSTNTSPALQDRIGVFGNSTPAPNWGYGVRGDGGYIGVWGNATLNGTGGRYGVLASASNGSAYNTGVSGSGSGNNSSSKYGGNFYAVGDGGTKYGVYGAASGTGANYGVYCNGNGAYTGSWAKVSDMRAKKNIKDYSGALAKVMTVGVKQYDFDRTAYPTLNLKSKSEVGVIAQDLEKVFPDLVEDIVSPVNPTNTGKDMDGKTFTLKGVDYISLVPILLQAIKEQQAQIDALKKQVGG